MNFGNLILLQPELIDNYASALINTIRSEPQDLGCIAEDLALSGDFGIPKEVRLSDAEQEELFLIAMVLDMQFL